MKVIVVDEKNDWLFYGSVSSFEEAFAAAREADEYFCHYTMYAFKIAELDETGAVQAEELGCDETDHK